MRRWIAKLLLVVCVGMALAFLSAWWCALRSPLKWPGLPTVGPFNKRVVERTSESDRSGLRACRREVVQVMRMEPAGGLYYHVRRTCFDEEYFAGWPLPGLSWTAHGIDEERGRVWMSSPVSLGAPTRTAAETGIAVPKFLSALSRDTGRRLPLIPTWGFVADTMLFAAATGALVEGPAFILRRVRRYRGRCPYCGYDLTGAPSPTCPECGKPAA